MNPELVTRGNNLCWNEKQRLAREPLLSPGALETSASSRPRWQR
jgi:hypothetical protein